MNKVNDILQKINRSSKLDGICYDLRGPALRRAQKMEEEGHRIIKLNVGNPAVFGLETPDEILRDVIHNLPYAQAYCDSKGLYQARKAVMQYFQQLGVLDVDVGQVYMGNGVSELIVMSMQALLENGDEVLLPTPDYPLWSAAVTLCGGKPVYYRCDENQGWLPDVEHIQSLITPKSRALVVISPNNPTGAVYPEALLKELCTIAEKSQLLLCADEVYDKIVYDDATYVPLASLAANVPCLSFSGLSKTYRLAGFRCGWLVISGDLTAMEDYTHGLDILASMRLCSNVPAQYAVQTALGGYQSIKDLVQPGGRLANQREAAWQGLTSLPGVTCNKPDGAIYLFAQLDERYRIKDDAKFVLDFLASEKVLLTEGSAFNYKNSSHFRLVFLPTVEVINEIIERLRRFLKHYHQ